RLEVRERAAVEAGLDTRSRAVKVAQAVPLARDARQDGPQDGYRAPDGAAAAVVVAVLGDVEGAVGGEGQAVRVAQAPGDHLGVAALGADAEHGAGAQGLPLDDLSLVGGRAEGHVGAGFGRVVLI